MEVNDDAGYLIPRVALASIASKLAPTGKAAFPHPLTASIVTINSMKFS